VWTIQEKRGFKLWLKHYYFFHHYFACFGIVFCSIVVVWGSFWSFFRYFRIWVDFTQKWFFFIFFFFDDLSWTWVKVKSTLFRILVLIRDPKKDIMTKSKQAMPYHKMFQIFKNLSHKFVNIFSNLEIYEFLFKTQPFKSHILKLQFFSKTESTPYFYPIFGPKNC
jgi:hypothetical protein